MTITLNDLTSIGLCLATEELFDVKRFQQNFCDNLLLRQKDKNLEPIIMPVKRDLNSLINQKKFLDGHKTAIINNIDKILALVASKYANINLKTAEMIMREGKELIKKVLLAKDFTDIAILEPTFRSKITLSVYQLFIEYMKRAKVSVV